MRNSIPILKLFIIETTDVHVKWRNSSKVLTIRLSLTFMKSFQLNQLQFYLFLFVKAIKIKLYFVVRNHITINISDILS